MKKTIDGIIKDWGERLDYGRVKGRKGKNVRSGSSGAREEPKLRPAGREKLIATLTKKPEVMVKISGGGKDMRRIKSHMDYISRNGEIELEDENGMTYRGKDEVRDVRDAWAKGRIGIPYESDKRREAFNIVLSMPEGTDHAGLKNAARTFASEMFSNHQYAFAMHTYETDPDPHPSKHPHVHLTVKAVDNNGIRMNPRKADLQHWRELFAEKLREQGIEANATPRKIRGVVRKAERQDVRHINKGHAEGKRKAPARVTAAQIEAAAQEANGGQKHQNPAQDNIIAQRKNVQHDFGAIARALAAGDLEDKQLAVEVVQFVKQMPPLTTQHEQHVHALQQTARDDRTDRDQRVERKPEINKDKGGEDALSR